MKRKEKWTRNQKILLISIIVTFVLALIGFAIQCYQISVMKNQQVTMKQEWDIVKAGVGEFYSIKLLSKEGSSCGCDSLCNNGSGWIINTSNC